METTGLKFRKTSLIGMAMIATAGIFKVKVLNNVSENNLFTDEKGQSRYIVNLKAITADKKEQLKAVFGSEEEVPVEQTNGLFLTASIWSKEGTATRLPMKNEEVEIAVDFVADRDGNQVLRVTNIRVLAAAKAKVLDLSDLFTESKEEVYQGDVLETVK